VRDRRRQVGVRPIRTQDLIGPEGERALGGLCVGDDGHNAFAGH
jgi:hypothetical protein